MFVQEEMDVMGIRIGKIQFLNIQITYNYILLF